MTLEDALNVFAIELNLSVADMISYADEDDIGGFPRHWPVGSMFQSEGKILYSLIRALKPRVVVEFGVRYGCSSAHITAALVANGIGKLYSYDTEPIIIQERFSEAMLNCWELIVDDARTAVNLPDFADIVFEDTDHTYMTTKILITRAVKLNPYLILAHDGEHRFVGNAVRTGFNEAVNVFPSPTLCTDESDCGFVYWTVGV